MAEKVRSTLNCLFAITTEWVIRLLARPPLGHCTDKKSIRAVEVLIPKFPKVH